MKYRPSKKALGKVDLEGGAADQGGVLSVSDSEDQNPDR